MRDRRILTDDERDRAARIVALLSVLVHARTVDDFRAAAQARDELLSLGVKVEFPRRQSKGVAHA